MGTFLLQRKLMNICFFRSGERTIDTDRLVEKIKKVLDSNDETAVRFWESTDEFDETWIEFIQTHLKHLIPVSEVERSRSWFKLLPNFENPLESRWQCRICNKMRGISLLKEYQLPEVGSDSGIMKKNKALNRHLLTTHPNTVAHKR